MEKIQEQPGSAKADYISRPCQSTLSLVLALRSVVLRKPVHQEDMDDIFRVGSSTLRKIDRVYVDIVDIPVVRSTDSLTRRTILTAARS